MLILHNQSETHTCLYTQCTQSAFVLDLVLGLWVLIDDELTASTGWSLALNTETSNNVYI